MTHSNNRFTARATIEIQFGVKNSSAIVAQAPDSTLNSTALDPYPDSVLGPLFTASGGLALGMTVVGAALSPVVFWGLWGGPTYWFGTVLATVTAPGLMRFQPRTPLSLTSIPAAMATGYCAALGCGKVGTFTADALLAASRGRPWPNVANLEPAVGFWLAAGILGLLAVLLSGPSGRRFGSWAPVLWLASAPATAMLLCLLYQFNVVALSA